MGWYVLDIDDVLVCLSQINESNLHETKHFRLRVHQRKSDTHPDIDGVYAQIHNEKPVAISKQDDKKFKLNYELNNGYDLTLIISIIKSKPLIINLVTTYIEESRKRRREDAEKVESN